MENSSTTPVRLDDVTVAAFVADMDDEARSTEILAFIGERRRQHQRDLETLWQIVNEARAERDAACHERDVLRSEVDSLLAAVGHLEHQLEVFRNSGQPVGPVARSVRRAVTVGRAAARSWR